MRWISWRWGEQPLEFLHSRELKEVGYGILENLVTVDGFDAEDAINRSDYFLEKELREGDGIIYTVFPPGAAAGGGGRRRIRRRIRKHKTMRKRRSYRRRRALETRRRR